MSSDYNGLRTLSICKVRCDVDNAQVGASLFVSSSLDTKLAQKSPPSSGPVRPGYLLASRSSSVPVFADVE